MGKGKRTIRIALIAVAIGSLGCIGFGIGWAISSKNVESSSPNDENAVAGGDNPSGDTVLHEKAGNLPPIIPDVTAWPDSNVSYSCQPSSDHPTDGHFQLSSGNRAVNKAYNLAMCETNENVQDGVWIAGNGWTQLWTRDTSYAVEQAAGLLRPDISLTSLEKCVQEWQIEEADGDNKRVWFQDECGHFG